MKWAVFTAHFTSLRYRHWERSRLGCSSVCLAPNIRLQVLIHQMNVKARIAER